MVISFSRCDKIKIEDAIRYIENLPWEGPESVDKTEVDCLTQILTKDKYEDFDGDYSSLSYWLHKDRYDEMKQAQKAVLDFLMEGQDPVTEEEMDAIREEWK